MLILAVKGLAFNIWLLTVPSPSIVSKSILYTLSRVKKVFYPLSVLF